jgi:hypothetical protein
MPPTHPLGKFLLLAGLVLAAVGLLLMVGGQFGLGRLPGDFHFKRGNFEVYLPLATGLLVSLVLSLILWIFRR